MGNSKGVFSLLFRLAGLFMAIGLFLMIYSYFNDDENIINRAIANNDVVIPFEGELNVIYIIKDVNTYCRPCSGYELLKMVAANRITFFVPQDFTDPDLVNFREAFKIIVNHRVERIPDDWQYLYQKYYSKKDNVTNLVISIDKERKVSYYRRF